MWQVAPLAHSNAEQSSSTACQQFFFFLLNLLENLINMLSLVYAPKLFFMEQSQLLNLWLTRCGQEIKYHTAAVIKTPQRRLEIRWLGSSNLGDFPFTMVIISAV
eukprot:TRINITY_DN21083_c1_g1_i1.p1 TRINITY_DN21083_c1_g1~~TRINITY_DN21083_c1_g1_i1.p1  ORF type:complete len:105 (+),score=14.96 TRINITY_DN21083_c1_g1_i1:106-420(+)